MGMTPPPLKITINGSHGEGGGALLRTALAVSALTVQPVRIHHIRGGTRKPGIRSEDLLFLSALSSVSGAEVEGDELGSQDLSFFPKHAPRPLRDELDIRSFEKGAVPGNALMVAESLVPVLARAGAYSSFRLSGETYNPNTLTFDAFVMATALAHRKQGIQIDASQISAGFGFAGHGQVHFELEPSLVNGFEWLSKGALKSLRAAFAVSEIAPDVVMRGVQTLESVTKAAGYDLDLDVFDVEAKMPGLHLTLVAEYERGIGTGSAMGARSVRIESVVEQAWSQIQSFMRSTATLDPFLADQVLVPAAFAIGPTAFHTQEITPRLQTMAFVIRQFVPIAITILGRTGEPGKVTIEPAG